MDIIFIERLQTQAIIGIYDWERQQPQPLIFDLELHLPIGKAAQSDAIDDTVDYKQVADEIGELVRDSGFELLESLAEFLCNHLFTHYPALDSVRMKISKPQAVSQADNVGLILQRKRPV
jgi:dihydroneopterin aldolase